MARVSALEGGISLTCRVGSQNVRKPKTGRIMHYTFGVYCIRVIVDSRKMLKRGRSFDVLIA